MATNRRMGPRDSEGSIALLDATERVMVNEGYAAVSSRRVAEEAGVKQPLVYYYFQTIDDLLLATFRRRTERALARLKATLDSEHPLRTLWDLSNEMSGARLSAEFMALANHHPGIMAEVVRYIEQSRAIEAEALSRLLPGSRADLTPSAMSLVITSISQTLARESAAGISAGHDDVRSWVADLLARFDPPQP